MIPLDVDTVLLFKQLYEQDNTKEEMMAKHDILKNFFGTLDRARELLQDESWTVPTKETRKTRA